MSEQNQSNYETDHIFDNAFLSICAWDKRLLIPLVNEIFEKKFPENSEVLHSPNEVFSHRKEDEHSILIKRITDAMVHVGDEKYHFECQSKKDGSILLRIAEYDSLIGLTDAISEGDNARIVLPETAVIYLRNHRSIPQSSEITYICGNEKIVRKIPNFEVAKHDLDYLYEKHLFALFPFYLMRYENALIRNDENKLNMIVNEAERVYNLLTKAYKDKLINQKEYENILVLSKDVVSRIGRRSSINKRLEAIMGTEVLLTAEERGIEQGKQLGIEQELISLVNEGILDAEVAAKRLGISLQKVHEKVQILKQENSKGISSMTISIK